MPYGDALKKTARMDLKKKEKLYVAENT